MRWNLLVMHAEAARGDDAGIIIDPVEWDYVALGGEHKRRKLSDQVRYPGSLERVALDPWKEAADEKGFLTANLETGEVGELMIKGPLVMQGYYGNEEATKAAIEPDGWMHTGDVAKMDEGGYIYIVDRRKDMILTAGFNIYPAELERVIAAHPDVALVAVGGQPDEAKGEIAKAYIVLREGKQGDVESILAHCREHLAAYKVPKRVQFVDDLPKTSTGKVMRRELKTLDPVEERESAAE